LVDKWWDWVVAFGHKSDVKDEISWMGWLDFKKI